MVVVDVVVVVVAVVSVVVTLVTAGFDGLAIAHTITMSTTTMTAMIIAFLEFFGLSGAAVVGSISFQ